MKPSRTARVTSRDGLNGIAELPDELWDSAAQARVRLDDGRQILAPAGLLVPEADGSYRLPVDLAVSASPEGSQVRGSDTVLVIPVIQEDLEVRKRAYSTGGVRVTKHVREWEEVVEEAGFHEDVEVERVAVDRPLEEPVSPYMEGDTLVIPLMEEVLVVEKRLILREEVRITRRRTETGQPQRVSLRREEVTIDPIPGGAEET